MKKTMKSMLVMAILCTNIAVVAKSNYYYSSEPLTKAKLSTINFKNFDGDLNITIKDSYGLIFFKEKFKGVDFKNTYDLTSLPTGKYFFEINGQTKIKVVPFYVKERVVSFENDKEQIYFKPIVREHEDNLFSISMVALNAKSLKIKLYDMESNLIYSEELTDDLYLGRFINISNLDSGVYKLVMQSNGRTFVERIRK
jgi:hypothetical protein